MKEVDISPICDPGPCRLMDIYRNVGVFFFYQLLNYNQTICI